MARRNPGGLRRPNNTGSIVARQLASGELRYHARLRNQFLGSFETRATAQRAIEFAQAQLAARTESLP